MTKKKQALAGHLAALGAGLVFGMFPLVSHAVPANVPGTSDPWLAGMPTGSTASGGDVAPGQSPAQVVGLNLGLGGFLTFTGATGGVSNVSGCPPSCAPIDGGGFVNHAGGAENGISDVRAPITQQSEI